MYNKGHTRFERLKAFIREGLIKDATELHDGKRRTEGFRHFIQTRD